MDFDLEEELGKVDESQLEDVEVEVPRTSLDALLTPPPAPLNLKKKKSKEVLGEGADSPTSAAIVAEVGPIEGRKEGIRTPEDEDEDDFVDAMDDGEDSRFSNVPLTATPRSGSGIPLALRESISVPSTSINGGPHGGNDASSINSVTPSSSIGSATRVERRSMVSMSSFSFGGGRASLDSPEKGQGTNKPARLLTHKKSASSHTLGSLTSLRMSATISPNPGVRGSMGNLPFLLQRLDVQKSGDGDTSLKEEQARQQLQEEFERMRVKEKLKTTSEEKETSDGDAEAKIDWGE